MEDDSLFKYRKPESEEQKNRRIKIMQEKAVREIGEGIVLGGESPLARYERLFHVLLKRKQARDN